MSDRVCVYSNSFSFQMGVTQNKIDKKYRKSQI